LNREECITITRIVGLALLVCLSLLAPQAKASQQNQTVPTMPPPTTASSNTPSRTPTSQSKVTATRPEPSATSVLVTLIPPTETVKESATSTLMGTSVKRTSAPSLIVGATSSQTLINATASLLTSTPAIARVSGNNLGTYGVIGGGLVLVILIAVWLWLRGKQRQVKE
jgi:hypothetical protein